MVLLICILTGVLAVNPEDDVAPELDAAVRGRENHRCCVTGWRDGVKPVYIVPPSIRQDSDLQPEVCLRALQLENIPLTVILLGLFTSSFGGYPI